MVRPEFSRQQLLVHKDSLLFRSSYGPNKLIDAATLLIQSDFPIYLLLSIIDYLVDVKKLSEVEIIVYIGQLIRSSLTLLDRGQVSDSSNAALLLENIHQIYAEGEMRTIIKLQKHIRTALIYNKLFGSKKIKHYQKSRHVKENESKKTPSATRGQSRRRRSSGLR